MLLALGYIAKLCCQAVLPSCAAVHGELFTHVNDDAEEDKIIVSSFQPIAKMTSI